MPQITLDIPEENIPLLMEVATAMGLDAKNLISKTDSPNWHSNILEERLGKYNSGKASLTDWKDAEQKLDKEDNGNV
jgi:hypothetical protein